MRCVSTAWDKIWKKGFSGAAASSSRRYLIASSAISVVRL
jgi:hypothetical protein